MKKVPNIFPFFNVESHRVQECAKTYIFSFVTSAIQLGNFGHQIFCKVPPFELSTGKFLVKYVKIYIRFIRVVIELHKQLGKTNDGWVEFSRWNTAWVDNLGLLWYQFIPFIDFISYFSPHHFYKAPVGILIQFVNIMSINKEMCNVFRFHVCEVWTIHGIFDKFVAKFEFHSWSYLPQAGHERHRKCWKGLEIYDW